MAVSKNDPTGEKRKFSRKVLWHFPLEARSQRLLMSSKTTSHMRWQKEQCTKDGYIIHTSDYLAWPTFDHQHPEFAKDCRNVRLGLASDEFNQFRNMNPSHSTRPVVLMPCEFTSLDVHETTIFHVIIVDTWTVFS